MDVPAKYSDTKHADDIPAKQPVSKHDDTQDSKQTEESSSAHTNVVPLSQSQSTEKPKVNVLICIWHWLLCNYYCFICKTFRLAPE